MLPDQYMMAGVAEKNQVQTARLVDRNGEDATWGGIIAASQQRLYC